MDAVKPKTEFSDVSILVLMEFAPQSPAFYHIMRKIAVSILVLMEFAPQSVTVVEAPVVVLVSILVLMEFAPQSRL